MRTLLFVLPLFFPAAPESGDPAAAEDEAVLRQAGVAADGPALLAFFRQRTPGEADLRRMEALVRQLGSEQFTERHRATVELKERGPAVLPLLRQALDNEDIELRRRARECIEHIENGPGPVLPAAAARVLARKAPAEAVPVLLGYLPFADDDYVAEEVLDALAALTPKGKVPAVVVDALKAPQPAQRGGAAFLIGRRGDAGQRAAAAKLLADPDPSVRLRTARGLLLARDRRAVPVLVDLLADAPPEMAWQAEEVLYRLAGDTPPQRRWFLGKRGGWAAWYRQQGDGLDLARYEEGDRLLGLTLGIEYNTGRVWECGLDGSLRWEIKGLAGPMEAQVLPGGRVLLCESNNHLVSIRDVKGDVLWQMKINEGEPTGCQRLPNGNTFVSTYAMAMEFDPNGKRLYAIPLGGGSNAIRKTRNGHIAYTNEAEVVEVDTAGNKVRAVPLPQDSMWVGVCDLPGDRYLVASSSSGRVLEVDRDGKVLWEGQVAGACGIARLPNGHTLVATAGRVVELDRGGKQVWEKKTEGYVRRVHRR